MSERLQGHDPDVQLARLGQRCRSLAPSLYREQALYLQQVRSLLPTAVKTAIQNLLCTLPSDHPEVLDEHQLQFQKRIDALLQRSSSLITVEQLLVLSARLKKEERRLRMQQLQALSERASERADATQMVCATLKSDFSRGSRPTVRRMLPGSASPEVSMMHRLMPPSA